MFNKNSCRMCGTYLTPSALCKICDEFVSWICLKCNKIEEEAKHSDYYCTVLMSRRLELGLQDSNRFEMIINR